MEKESQLNLIHGLPARSWKRKPEKEMTVKECEAQREHRAAAIRVLADKLADQFSDLGRSVSARQVLDMLETLWPKECRRELARGRE